MKVTFRKALMAAAVGMAFGGSAQAASVLFDVNGSAGPNKVGVDQFKINLFAWAPGNLLLKDATPVAGALSDPLFSQVLAQSVLSSVKGSGGVSFAYNQVGGIVGQLTYQLSLNVQYTAGAGTSTDVNQATVLGTVVPGLFQIFYNSAPVANDVTGCGFGDSLGAGVTYGANTALHCAGVGGAATQKLIYSGAATLVATANLTDSGTLAPQNLTNVPASATGDMDRFDDPPDVDEGVRTNTLGLGTLSINVDTIFADTTFFLTNITSLPTDINHSEQGGGSPFNQVNPSDEVVGSQISRTAGFVDSANPLAAAFRAGTYGTDGINNTGATSCGAAADVTGSLTPGICDVHLQGNASSSILTTPVPEPQSLALLGLGLGMLAFSLRRRMTRPMI